VTPSRPYWRALGCVAELVSFLVVLAAILELVLFLGALTTSGPS
jgi:hypothetical protein